MHILMINLPHPAIGSRLSRERLPPLGLLAIGGPLMDEGHAVMLLDAELDYLPLDESVRHTVTRRPVGGAATGTWWPLRTSPAVYLQQNSGQSQRIGTRGAPSVC